jgi:hypothetical protein
MRLTLIVLWAAAARCEMMCHGDVYGCFVTRIDADGVGHGEPCPAGTFSLNLHEWGRCATTCAPGTFSTGGATSCTACPAGSYSSIYGASACKTCAAGKAAAPGASDCTGCPAGSVSRAGGECTACAAGKYSKSTTVCLPCPAQTYSARSGTVSIDKCLPCTRAIKTVPHTPAGSTACKK